jgi:hypothetical protein
MNIKAILSGFSLLILFYIAVHFSWKDKHIRETGTVMRAPISGFDSESTVTVTINGKKYNAGSFDEDGYSIGDFIEVCYIPGEYCVVQKKVNPKRYVWFLGLESIFLPISVCLILRGILIKQKK